MSSRMLNIGKSGLDVSKQSLETTSHNLANVNTEGYSRQRVRQTANAPIERNGVIQGTGAYLHGVNRIHDEHVEKRLGNAISDGSFHSARHDKLSQIEQVFNDLDGKGMNQIINKFFNSFRSLAANPANDTMRSVIRDDAKLIINDFKKIRATLDDHARNVDRNIQKSVEDINSLTGSVANLNKKIREFEASGQETGDLRDQRDKAIRNLSDIFKVKTYVSEKGHFIVNAVGTGTLVAGGERQELIARPVPLDKSTNGMASSYEVFLKKRPSEPISNNFRGGSLKGIIELRNNDLKELQDKIDFLAFNFVKSVNAIHRKGFSNRPVSANADGSMADFDAKGKLKGINFFKEPTEVGGASADIDMSDEIKDDLSNIVTAVAPNSPGDNRIALAISKLQHEKILAGGTSTLEDEYLKTVGSIGIKAGKAQVEAEQNEGILAQVSSIKERVSGVSIDEETANLVRYQHAYEASAKVMKTAEDMFQTVLNLKR